MTIRSLIHADALNIGGITLYAHMVVWFPATFYEMVTWSIGSLVGISLIVMNVVKTAHELKNEKDKTKKPK